MRPLRNSINGDRTCARRQLGALITGFPVSAEAEPALYELSQTSPDCATAVPLLERYLTRHADGRFAAGARRQRKFSPHSVIDRQF
jgi:hypothetical protein